MTHPIPTKLRLFLRRFKRRTEGSISVEFALASPIMLFSSLMAADLGFDVFSHQKLGGSLTNGAAYLQDYMLENEIDDLNPTFNAETNKWTESQPMKVARALIQDSYGSALRSEDINFEILCGCPDEAQVDETNGTVSEAYSGYYKEVSQKNYAGYGKVCPMQCGGEDSRVTVKISVSFVARDLTGEHQVYEQTLRTRLR